MDDKEKGRSTAQILSTKPYAIYVVPYGSIMHFRTLAQELGKDTLKVVTPSWLCEHRWRGTIFSEVIVDHSVLLNKDQRQGLVNARCHACPEVNL